MGANKQPNPGWRVKPCRTTIQLELYGPIQRGSKDEVVYQPAEFILGQFLCELPTWRSGWISVTWAATGGGGDGWTIPSGGSICYRQLEGEQQADLGYGNSLGLFFAISRGERPLELSQPESDQQRYRNAWRVTVRRELRWSGR